MHRLASALAIAALAFTGCANNSTPSVDGRDDSFTTDGKLDGFLCTPQEAVAILEVANTMSLADLKSEVDLAAKAADNIVAFRLGDDESEGTSDDETFGSLAELDHVPYIGPTAFGKLLDYVHAADLVDDDPVREWHTETVANGAVADFTVSKDGKPVVVYYTGAPPYQLRLPNGTTIELPADAIRTGQGSPKVAVDSTGAPHVFYEAGPASGPDNFNHASYKNGQWTQHEVLPGDVNSNLHVDQGPGGQIFVLENHYVGSSGYQNTLYTVASNGTTTSESLWLSDGEEIHFNVDLDGFPALAWERTTVRTGRRTATGWVTRDTGFAESVTAIATTGGANPTVGVERPLYDPALQTFHPEGGAFAEGQTFEHGSTVSNMDATVDELGTAHICEITDGNVVHLQVDPTGALTPTIVGSADRCWIGLDASGKVHMMWSLGSVINHGTFE
jgi:hypothetical protein